MSAIICHGLEAGYNGRRVLHDVHLEVAAGEWVALIGPNGAGKSTLLRALAGTLPADGDVRLGGAPVGALSRRQVARSVAVVPQQPTIPEGMRVRDYVLLGRNPYLPFWAVEKPSDLERVLDTLERLDLGELADRPLQRLSGGELQRAVLARALAQDASILLLDEPTSSLDIGHQQQVLELVDGLRRERALVVLSAIHDLTLAAQYPDRLVLLDDGRVVADGSAEEVVTVDRVRTHFGASVSILRDDEDRMVVAPHRGSGPVAAAHRSRPEHEMS